MRRKYFLYGFFCVLAVCGIIASLAVDLASRPVHARKGDFHVVIDAGHGGRDGGAMGRSGTKESDINLAISKFLAAELQNHGIGVTLTRETRDSLASPFAKNKKRDDMEKRRAIIEQVKPDLVVSIHLNSFPSHPAVRGLQTFFDKTGEQSKVYATAIQKQVNDSSLGIDRRAAVGDYYILECTPYPSVLVECGFLSNPSEEKLLKTEEYQRILARHIARAICLTAAQHCVKLQQ